MSDGQVTGDHGVVGNPLKYIFESWEEEALGFQWEGPWGLSYSSWSVDP